MGKRGPRPEPVEILRLRGSQHQYDRKGEPDIIQGDAEPPEWLSDGAREQWNRMVLRLTESQVMSEAWRESLAQACFWWDRFETLAKRASKEPVTIVTGNGVTRINPFHTALADASEKAMRYGREFGWTPAAKASVRVEETPQKTSKKKHFA